MARAKPALGAGRPNPTITRVAILWNATGEATGTELVAVQEAAARFGLRADSFAVRLPLDFEKAFGAMRQMRSDALLVVSDSLWLSTGARSRVSRLRNGYPQSTRFGSLSKRAGSCAPTARTPRKCSVGSQAMWTGILKGAKPDDLPVEQPTKLELVVNLKTDLHEPIEDVVAEGDRVVLRYSAVGTLTGLFLGHAPTGKRMKIGGITIFRVEDGKIAERTPAASLSSLLEQTDPGRDEFAFCGRSPDGKLDEAGGSALRGFMTQTTTS